jgi:hypothetical protein
LAAFNGGLIAVLNLCSKSGRRAGCPAVAPRTGRRLFPSPPEAVEAEKLPNSRSFFDFHI